MKKSPRLNSTDQLLQTLLLEDPDNTLWLADESALTLLEHDSAGLPALLTNRFDIAAQVQNGQCWFNDWDLQPAFKDKHYTRIIYRLSKEKLVSHHLLNQLADILTDGDEIILLGQKNEGIKSIADSAATCFGNKKIQKKGADYLVHIAAGRQSAVRLDAKDYNHLRPTLEWQHQTLVSKPGTFGWQKIDDGSQFLLDAMVEFAGQLPPPPRRILDLGCGYGFLSTGARTQFGADSPHTTWLATDNCAAALSACAANCGAWADVFAGDRGLDPAGQPLREPVDLIVCNPPFHQGFSPTVDITDRFLQAMHRWLVPGGQALVVVNQFVGIEKKAKGLFKSSHALANNGSFKVMLLKR